MFEKGRVLKPELTREQVKSVKTIAPVSYSHSLISKNLRAIEDVIRAARFRIVKHEKKRKDYAVEKNRLSLRLTLENKFMKRDMKKVQETDLDAAATVNNYLEKTVFPALNKSHDSVALAEIERWVNDYAEQHKQANYKAKGLVDQLLFKRKIS